MDAAQAGRREIVILGSTGSIGTQAADVIRRNPDRFRIAGVAAGGGNPDLLARQRAETGVTNIAVADHAAAAQVGDVRYAGTDAVTRRRTRGNPTISTVSRRTGLS